MSQPSTETSIRRPGQHLFCFLIYYCVQIWGQTHISALTQKPSCDAWMLFPSPTFQWTWGLVITDERQVRISFFFSFCFFYCSSLPGCEMWPLIRFLQAASSPGSCSTTISPLYIYISRHCVWLWVNYCHNSCCRFWHSACWFSVSGVSLLLCQTYRFHSRWQRQQQQNSVGREKKKKTQGNYQSTTSLHSASFSLPFLTPVHPIHLTHLLKSPHMRQLGSDEPVGVLIGHVFEKIFCLCNTSFQFKGAGKAAIPNPDTTNFAVNHSQVWGVAKYLQQLLTARSLSLAWSPAKWTSLLITKKW